MPVVIQYDADTALYSAKTEAAQKKFVQDAAKAAGLAGEEYKAYVKNVEKQFRDLAKEQARLAKDAAKAQAQAAKEAERAQLESIEAVKKAEEQRKVRNAKEQAAIKDSFGDAADAVGRLGTALGSVAPKQLELAENALDLAETGAKFGGVWGAAAGLVVGAIAGAIKRQEELREEVRKSFSEIDSYVEKFQEGGRARDRALGRLFGGKDGGALQSEAERTEEALATSRDKLADLTRQVTKAEKEAEEQRGLLTKGTVSHAEAELQLGLAQEERIRIGTELVGVMALQAAEAEKLRRAAIDAEIAEDTERRKRREREDLLGGIAAEREAAALGGEAERERKRTTREKGRAEAQRAYQEEAERGLKILEWREESRNATIQKSIELLEHFQNAQKSLRTQAEAEGGQLESALQQLAAFGPSISRTFGPEAVEAWTRGPKELAKVLEQAKVAAELKAANDSLALLLESGVTPLLDNTAVALSLLQDQLRSLGATATDAIGGVAAGAFGEFFDAIESRQDALKALGASLKSLAANALKQIGTELIASGVKDSLYAISQLVLGNPGGAAILAGNAAAQISAGLAMGGVGALLGRGKGKGGDSGGSRSSAGGSSGLGREADRGGQQQPASVTHITWQSLEIPDDRTIERVGKQIEKARLAHARRGGRLLS